MAGLTSAAGTVAVKGGLLGALYSSAAADGSSNASKLVYIGESAKIANDNGIGVWEYSGPRKLDSLLRNVFLYRTQFATGGSCNGSEEEAYSPA